MMEDIFFEVLKGVEKKYEYLKELRANIFGISQKVGSYPTTIKQLEEKICQMFIVLTQCQQGTL